jgi:adenylate cyclase
MPEEATVVSTSRIRYGLHELAHVGVLPTDSDEERLRKATLTLIVVIIVPLATIWTVTYGTLGHWWSALIPLWYQILAATSFLVFVWNKRYLLFCFVQLLLILLLPLLMHLSLGGFAASSGVVLWSFVAPLGALLCRGTRYSIPWFVAFGLVITAAAIADPLVAQRSAGLPQWIRILFFALNLFTVSLTSFLLLQYFVRGRDVARWELDLKHQELQQEQARSEQLLLNILPEPIAGRLKAGETLIADGVPDATVLFADIVGFTSMSRRIEPEKLIVVLNDLFSSFDKLAEQHCLEKIKTIGDSYMLVGGIPEWRDDHVEAVCNMALAMQPAMRALSHDLDYALSLRIGIDTGPVVAGVIGQRKFSYDIWGDTVNTASRMATFGSPGAIQVTGNVVSRLKDQYLFQSRGAVEVKGKGMMHVYLLRGPLSAREPERTSAPAPTPAN